MCSRLCHFFPLICFAVYRLLYCLLCWNCHTLIMVKVKLNEITIVRWVSFNPPRSNWYHLLWMKAKRCLFSPVILANTQNFMTKFCCGFTCWAVFNDWFTVSPSYDSPCQVQWLIIPSFARIKYVLYGQLVSVPLHMIALCESSFTTHQHLHSIPWSSVLYEWAFWRWVWMESCVSKCL